LYRIRKGFALPTTYPWSEITSGYANWDGNPKSHRRRP